MATLTLNITQCPIYEICDTNVSGATITSSGYSRISAGMLQLTTGILGDYAIEWRLDAEDGELLFVSGNLGNTDTNISRYHDPAVPGFIDEVVPGGTIYPVIKYIYVDSVRYDGYYSEGTNYSPDLRLCLTATPVEEMTCDGGNQLTDYSHSISYNHTNPNGQSSSRVMIFQYPNDGSEAYFAFSIFAEDVADLFDFYAVKEGPTDTVTHLVGAMVGAVQAENDGLVLSGDSLYDSSKTRYRSTTQYTSFRYDYVINLTGIDCDYIRIEVTASADYPIQTKTIWDVDFKCLNTFTCPTYIVNTGWTTIDVDNINVVWSSGTCEYICYVPSFALYSSPTDYTKYISNRKIIGYINNSSSGLNTICRIPINIDGDRVNFNVGTTCSALNGNLSLTKDETANILKIEFSNRDDMLYYKSSYDTVHDDYRMAYSTDNTDIDFYKYITLFQKVRFTDCNEDGYTDSYYYFHPSCPVTFNDVPGDYYMEILHPTNTNDPTNLYPLHHPFVGGLPPVCGDLDELGNNSFIGLINQSFNYSIEQIDSNYKVQNPFYGTYLISGFTDQNWTIAREYADYYRPAVDEVCPTYYGSEYSINAQPTSIMSWFGPGYRFTKCYVKFVMTGEDLTDGASEGDYDVFDLNNGSALIKRVVGGVNQPI